MPAEKTPQASSAPSPRLRRAAAAAVAALVAFVLAGCGGSDPGDGVVSGLAVDDSGSLNGSVVDDGWQLPGASLEDTDGRQVSLAGSAQAPITLLFFGYTHCPDVCLAVMADVAGALNRLDSEQAEQVEVWFVTTDPARDDGPAVREWLDRFDPDFEGYTGPLSRIVELAEAMHVPIEKGRRLETGGYEVDHGTPVLGLVPGGDARVVWTQGTSAAKLADDLAAILDDPEQLGVAS